MKKSLFSQKRAALGLRTGQGGGQSREVLQRQLFPPDGGGQVVFAPQIVVQGNADRAVLESVLDDAQQRFELWYEQMMRRKARTAY